MFIHNIKDNINYLTIKSFEDSGLVRHAFSSRIGGVSIGETSSMNFGLNRKDTIDNINKNYELLCGAIGINKNQLVRTKQVHKDDVYVATKSDVGKYIESVDALITNDPSVAICTFHADCVPLFFLDTVKKVIALAHSGWRSTLLNIAARTIEKMQSTFDCNPADIIAAIGPSIGECHFEVDRDVADKFDKKYIVKYEKSHLNLWQLCKDQITESGVKENNITLTNLCTYCNNDLFYSYRGDNMKTGSMVAIMQLTEDK